MRVDLLAALHGTGLTVVEHAGWRTRGSSTFTPRVVVRHATITPAHWSDEKTCRLLIDGYDGLPGPLCQIGLDRRGRVHILASGRANHAGRGGWAGFSGNSSALGVEAFNDGREPWPVAQYRAWDVLDAALLRYLDLTADRLCSHQEWAPTRKTDPAGISMRDARARVHALLNPPPPPPPAQPKGPPHMVIVKNPSGNDQHLVHMGRRWRIASMEELRAYSAVCPRVELDQPSFDRLVEAS